jgi:hypothetical protein
MYKYKVVYLAKLNDFITNNSTLLILSAMNYTKMNMSQKPNITIIIIEKDGSY